MPQKLALGAKTCAGREEDRSRRCIHSSRRSNSWFLIWLRTRSTLELTSNTTANRNTVLHGLAAKTCAGREKDRSKRCIDYNLKTGKSSRLIFQGFPNTIHCSPASSLASMKIQREKFPALGAKRTEITCAGRESTCKQELEWFITSFFFEYQ